MKRFLSLCAAFCAACVMGGWQTERSADGGSIVLYNDGGDAALKAKKGIIFPMAGSGVCMKKEFDLTRLPPEWRSDIGGAALRLHLSVGDQSRAVKKLPKANGLTEEILLIVNGREIKLPTASPLLTAPPAKWRDIPIPAELIKGDKLDLRIRKVASATNDDYFYVTMDTSAPQESSLISVDGGRHFAKESKHIPGRRGEFMARLVLYRGKQELHVNFKDPEAVKLFELKGGAEYRDGMLMFNGSTSAAVLKDSASFNVGEKGFTVAGVIRMDDNKGSSKSDHNMLFAHKHDSWFLGRTGNQINLSFSDHGKLWNNALFGSEFPDLGEWVHLAAVFERINEVAQGNVGYRLSLYLNGELSGQRFFLYAEPTRSPDPVIIGNGFGNGLYGFKGAVASLDIIARGLNEGEIAELVKKADHISKLPAGFYELRPETAAAFRSIVPRNALTGWLLGVLRRAVDTGYDQNVMIEILRRHGGLLSSDLSGKALIEKWNGACPQFTLIGSSGAVLAVANGRGSGNSPVLGMFDPVTGQDVFDGRAAGWMLDLGGRKIHDRSSGVTYETGPVKFTADGGSFHVVWRKAGDFECVSDFVFDGVRLEQDFEVKNLRGDVLLTSVDFPRYFLRKLPGKKDKLVFPYFCGVVYDEPAHSFGRIGSYPSAHSSMQFIGYYDELKNGVYAAFEATDAALKTHCVSGRSNVMEYKWSNPVAFPKQGKGGNGFKSAGCAVIQLYRGDWFEAGQIYKKFVEAKAPWAVRELPRKDTPKWYHENCFWMVASKEHYRGLSYLRDYFDLPYAIWLCRWQVVDRGTEKDSLPLLGFNEETKHAVAQLSAKGIYLHPYYNGHLLGWVEGQGEYVDRSKTDIFINGVGRERNGQPFWESYGRPWPVMCPGTKVWQEMLVRMGKVSVDNGVNGCYFDQLPCAQVRLCYASNHGHAPGDPRSWTHGYMTALRELRRRYPQIALDGEDNNEVYANTLDGYMTWRWSEPGHVPLFQSIYGGGRTQFTGRGFDAFGGYSGSYEATFAKLGEQFVFGEQIGWMHIFDIRWGTPRRLYAKKLAHLRRALLGYLNEADMLHPPEFAEPVPRTSAHWGCVNANIPWDKVLSSSWKRLHDGRILMLFTNTTDETVTVRPTTRYPGYDKLAVCSEGADGARFVELKDAASLPEVKLAPYASEVWLLGKDFDRGEAEKIAETARRVGTFTDPGKSIYHNAPSFHVCNKLKAAPGRWFSAMDASWMLYAFREIHPSVGFSRARHATPEQKGNWILAHAGSVVSYGEVGFGDKPPKFLEVQIAVSKENAGGKISFDDITAGSDVNHELAEITTECTGGFFRWRTVRVPLRPVTGKRKVVFHFTGKDCNFRAWRVL